MMKKVSLLSVLLSIAITFSCSEKDQDPKALFLNGSDGYVDLGNIYDELELPLTISAWIRVEEIDQYAPIFISQDNTPGYNGFMFIATPSGIAIQYGDGKGENNSAYRRGKSASSESIIGQWSYVTGVIRGAVDMDLYLNGEKLDGAYDGSSNLPMESDSPDEVAKIGYWSSNGIVSHFKGSIDDLNIWNRALIDEEIIETMCSKLKGTEEDLIGLWRFDEESGLTIRDESPAKYNGTILGGVERQVLSSESKPNFCN